ncbi:hypothetical protein GMA11_01360 [Granulicatella sp. zg-ZJ]|uniref:glucosyltransferase domain-containing protein n=1 Tax=Granulicatella sp. zg-ZJ TaxID=2678504 RepID=UPI0013D0EB5A|nr:glucosyltransferase domain-containing protein [Granulicatella sp. zg-ZJ]NEW62032.1 hypothetical protein [Granulicatella sp. zg-ZJ]
MKKGRIESFLRNNMMNIIVVLFFLLLTYGIKIFNIVISHDTEAIISVRDSQYEAWISMGRYGLVFMKWLIGTYDFNPYIASFMMITSLFVASLLWIYVIGYIQDDLDMKKQYRWVFPVICLTSPVFAEQSAFLLQSYEVSLSLSISAITVLCIYKGIMKKNIAYLIASVVSIAFLQSVYQALLLITFTGSVCGFVVFYDRFTRSEKYDTKGYLMIVGKILLVFVGGVLLCAITEKIVLSVLGIHKTAYITEQYLWAHANKLTVIKSILSHIGVVLFGGRIFYSYTLFISMLITCLFVALKYKNHQKGYFVYILSIFGVFVCPFLLTFILGQSLSARSELTIPFVCGFLVYYNIDQLQNIKKYDVLKTAVVVLTGLVAINQANTSARIYYTEYVKYQEDVMLATKLSNRLEEKFGKDAYTKPVVFVGYRSASLNESTYPESALELTGRSFFSVSFSTLHGTFVMENYLRTIGINFKSPSQKQIDIAEKISQNMTSWPSDESIIEYNGIIIIKL